MQFRNKLLGQLQYDLSIIPEQVPVDPSKLPVVKLGGESSDSDTIEEDSDNSLMN